MADHDRNEASLRGKIIRLAHAKPELREHLLPLVREGASSGLSKAKSAWSKVEKSWKDGNWEGVADNLWAIVKEAQSDSKGVDDSVSNAMSKARDALGDY